MGCLQGKTVYCHSDIERQELDLKGSIGRNIYYAKKNNKLVAVKIFAKTRASDTLKEIELMEKARGENVLEYHYSYSTPTHDCMVMELALRGTLLDFISFHTGRPPVVWRVLETIISQLAGAITHIHGKGIIHCDIKPDNVFITESHCIKVGDFGLGDVPALNVLGETPIRNSLSGTPTYMSPEMVCSKVVSYPTDWWSFGVTVYHLITSKLPCELDESTGMKELFVLILMANVSTLELRECLQAGGLDTFDVEEVLASIESLFEKDPTRRGNGDGFTGWVVADIPESSWPPAIHAQVSSREIGGDLITRPLKESAELSTTKI